MPRISKPSRGKPSRNKPSGYKPAVIADPGDNPDIETLRRYVAAQFETALVHTMGGSKQCRRRDCRRRKGCARPRGFCEWPRPSEPSSPESRARALHLLRRSLDKVIAQHDAAGTGKEKAEPAATAPKRPLKRPAGPTPR